jgi:hypothetical protein
VSRWLYAVGGASGAVGIVALLMAAPGFILDVRALFEPRPSASASIPAEIVPPDQVVEDSEPTDFEQIVGNGQGGAIVAIEPGGQHRTGRIESAARPAASSPASFQQTPRPPLFRVTRAMVRGLPDDREIARSYPRRALERGDGARVDVSCKPLRSGRFACEVLSPANGQFDRAAMRLLEGLWLPPQVAEQVTPDTPALIIPVRFEVKD